MIKKMIRKQKNFFKNKNITRCVICASLITLYSFVADAAVVSRSSTSTSRPTVTSSTRVTGRMPTASVNLPTTTDTVEETTEEPEPVEEEIIIENKANQFDTVLSTSSETSTDSSAENLAELIRQQRTELNAQTAINTANTNVKSGNGNACDKGLRSCMQEKCGEDFTECKGDTDTAWGNKMESCRRDLDCSGREYTLFAAEIKADRDINAQLAAYNAVINCGNQYNNCIMTECTETFSKCLGKSAGDAAIAKCKTIANNCIEQDSGLASRAMQLFAELRQTAEKQVQEDEKRLYELRDQMSQQCDTLGAMFDERTFSCVYTVNFYAGEDSTLYASKKLYAGDVFNCTPNWFGIDVTTFMENAYRLTRAQTSASASLLGSGLGVAAGAITSGAINRAIDRQKAENALNDAKEEYEDTYGDQSKEEDTDKQKTNTEKQEEKDTSRASQDELKKRCEANGGTWENNFCSEPECPEGEFYDDFTGECKKDTSIPSDERESRCAIAGGMWDNNTLTCICSNGGTFNTTTGICECGEGLKLENGKCVLDLKIDIPGGNTSSLKPRGLSSR